MYLDRKRESRCKTTLKLLLMMSPSSSPLVSPSFSNSKPCGPLLGFLAQHVSWSVPQSMIALALSPIPTSSYFANNGSSQPGSPGQSESVLPWLHTTSARIHTMELGWLATRLSRLSRCPFEPQLQSFVFTGSFFHEMISCLATLRNLGSL